MKTINTKFIKIAGLLLALSLSNYSYAGFINFLAFSDLTTDANQNIKFVIRESSGSKEIAATGLGGLLNTRIDINLIGLELDGATTDIYSGSPSLSTYFNIGYSAPVITFRQNSAIPAGTSISVSIPVSTTTTSGEVKYAISPSTSSPSDSISLPAQGKFLGGTPATITGGGGGVNQPNYGIGMDIASGGNNLGAVPSKMLPLEITVTNNIASADNTGPVVVALAKDSRLALATTCTPTNWTKTENSVAYLFTYANTDGSNTFAPDPTKTDSTIVCPVTVTRPTTQSGKLQLNAVLRHGSGDTKTSNDVASIEVTYN